MIGLLEKGYEVKKNDNEYDVNKLRNSIRIFIAGKRGREDLSPTLFNLDLCICEYVFRVFVLVFV